MEANPLTHPALALMRRVPGLRPEDSLQSAAVRFADMGTDVLAVVNGPYLLGVVTQPSLASALAAGTEPQDPVTRALGTAVTVPPHASGAEALRAMSNRGAGTVVVIDGEGRYMGLLSSSDLVPRRPLEPRPPVVGGMATPFGVYLTTGTLSAGAGGLALVATGALLFALFLGASLVAEWASTLMPAAWAAGSFAPMQMILFLLLMRLLPISGIHAAEHKVVHAIEREEALIPEIVARMPRVHPRCGTNVAAGASIFLGLAGATWIPDQQLRLLLAALATLALWRPVGSALQYYVTTRPPSRKHLEMGIRSGKELLERYRASGGGPRPSFARRIWSSGMLHVMAGSSLCYALAYAIVKAFSLPIAL